MIITDNDIINFYFGKNQKFIKRNNITYTDEIKNYLENRFNDSDSLFETIFRIKEKIEYHPICPICGKPVKFIGKPSKPFSTYCSRSCLSKANVEKIKTKYNTSCTLTLSEIKSKTKTTLQNKYGVTHNWQIPEVREKIVHNLKEKYGDNVFSYYITNKQKETCLNKYGDANYRNVTQTKQTCLERYGVDHPLKYDEFKVKGENTRLLKYGYKYISSIDGIKKQIQQKRYETMKQNNSFNISSIENKLKEYFDTHNINYIYQYKSEVYPFACDFYFPDKDLYVEIQGTWTHGGKPFDGTDEDLQLLQYWCDKNTLYYDNAIYVWTDLDVRKRNIAKENNLNYLEVFSIDLTTCIEQINLFLIT